MNMGNVLNESALRFYIWLTRSNFETHLLKSKIHLGSWERVIKTIRKKDRSYIRKNSERYYAQNFQQLNPVTSTYNPELTGNTGLTGRDELEVLYSVHCCFTRFRDIFPLLRSTFLSRQQHHCNNTWGNICIGYP